MALDKPHHTTSELFVCFTSRLSSSSSSMKLSKSILSPGHARDQPLSLPTSLSRRLKANGSIKGGQSPATFPSHTGKKRGSGFDNPEPSSPKVTCIGQVKMKTKKKVKQTRSLSNRRSDVSFRKLEQQAPDQERGLLIQTQRSSSVHFQPQDQCVHRNQRWVHLPSTIYEALREFSCLFPCRSSCFTTNNEKEKEEKVEGSREVTRWLVALQDAEVEKTRGIELMVSNHGREEMQSTMRSSRRHVFEDIIESVEMKEGVVEEEKARVSICIPPKNALLLMRCRSDPMKMADITSRFWESPTRKEGDKKENEGSEKEVVDAQNFKVPEETSVPVDLVENEENSKEAVDVVMEMETESSKNEEEKFKSGESTPETEQQDEKESEIKALVEEAEVTSTEQVPESIVDQTTENTQDNQVLEAEKEEEEAKPSFSGNIQADNHVLEPEKEEEEEAKPSFSEAEDATLEVKEEEEEDDERFKSTIKKVIEETLLLEHMDIEEDVKFDENEIKKKDVVAQVEYPKESRKIQNKSILPDCLLLMMCEPKLSMEVSKETWVCSTDFISPEKKQAKTANKNNEVIPERRRSIDYSKPAHTAQNYSKSQHLSTMIEQKLVNAKAYEPFVLTRCKSEPMRTAAARVAPESCFWKNRKIHEPHRRDKFGVGAAGLGF